MSKFKAGDKVKYVKDGSTYTVRHVDNLGSIYLDDKTHPCVTDVFELVEPVVVYEVGKTYGFLDSVLTCIAFTSKGLPVFEREEGTVFSKNGGIDFKEVVKPKSGKVWMNMYPDGDAFVYETKEIADGVAGKSRLACVEVSWTEGEGL